MLGIRYRLYKVHNRYAKASSIIGQFFLFGRGGGFLTCTELTEAKNAISKLALFDRSFIMTSWTP